MTMPKPKALQDAIALAWGIDDSRVIEWHIYTQRGRVPHTLAIVEVVRLPVQHEEGYQ